MMKLNVENDNRGLTLLELIVGVVILAIIVVPLLHTFVTGAYTASKNKQYQDATLAAQNIIEEIEATEMTSYLGTASCDEIQKKDDSGNGRVDKYDNPITYKKYTLPKAVESGGTEFDALVTITTDNDLNENEIAFSNQMDAIFAMQEVDLTADELFKGSANKDFSKLKRYITIDVNYASDTDHSTCKVTTTFEYSGSAKKAYYDSNEIEHSETIIFNYPIVSEMNVTQRSNEGDAFAIYLFFKAYEWSDENFYMGKTIINNNTEHNFNVFLVDVNDHNLTNTTTYNVEYKPKIADNNVELLTNMNNVIYKVYKCSGSNWQTPEQKEVGLVKTGAINRIFDITVEIYKHDPNQDYSNKLLDMETAKLDYSAQ